MIAIVIPTLDPHFCTPDDLEHVFVVYDGSPALLKHSRFLCSSQKGFAHACNVGLSHAQSLGYKWVLILNDDATISPQHLAQMCQKITPNTGVIGTVIRGDHGIQSAGIRLSFWGRVRVNRDPSKEQFEALSGACMLLGSWARFDEGYIHGFEDIELCIRLKKKGYDLFLDRDSYCVHKGGMSIPHHTRTWLAHSIYGQLRFYKKRRFFPIIMLLGFMQSNMNRALMLGVCDGGILWWNQRVSRAT